MGLFWLVFSIGICCWVVFILSLCFSWHEAIVCCSLFLGALGFMASLVLLIDSSDRIKEEDYKMLLCARERICGRIDIYSSSTHEISLEAYTELYDEVSRFDGRLEENESFRGSHWRSRKYSEDIAGISPILPEFMERFEVRKEVVRR